MVMEARFGNKASLDVSICFRLAGDAAASLCFESGCIGSGVRAGDDRLDIHSGAANARLRGSART